MHAAERYFRRRFREQGTAERATFEKAYLKSALRFHGVTQPQIRKAASEWCRAHPELDRDELVRVVDVLFATNFHDLRSAGIAILEKKSRLLDPADVDWLIVLVRRSPGWAHVDWLATKPIGALIARDPQLRRRLPHWAKDPDLWVRRTALLAELDALRKGDGDFALFTRIAAPLLEEREFFIRKAIGWVLREVSKRRPKLVRDFLREHGPRASAITLREAEKYL